MARPSTRQELIDYCLRALGEPVLEVNVDPDQLEDRVDQALQYYTEYHSDATYRTYQAVKITEEHVQFGFVALGDDVINVLRVLPASNIFNTTGDGIFDAQYQIMFDAINRGFLIAGDMSYYEQMKQHLSLLDMKLNGAIQFSWNRYGNQLFLHGEFGSDIKVGDIIVYEYMRDASTTAADEALMPGGVASTTSLYNNLFVKEYTTALIKQQWGANLIKFEGMQLPGGITLNGRQLFDDAQQEIERLQERLRSEFEAPVDFFVG